MAIIDKLIRKFGEETFHLDDAVRFTKKDRKSVSSSLSSFKRKKYIKRTKEGGFRFTAKAVHDRASYEPTVEQPVEPVYQNITVNKPLPLNMKTAEKHYVKYMCSIQDIANICDVTRHAAIKFLDDNGFERRSRAEQTRLNNKGTKYNIKFKSKFEERRKEAIPDTKSAAYEIDVVNAAMRKEIDDICRKEDEQAFKTIFPSPILDLETAIKELAGQWVISNPERLREFTDYLAQMLVDRESPYNTQRR